MIRKIPPATECFEYHNENPKGKHTGDCSVRCIATALGITWDEAVDLACEAAHKLKVEPFGRQMTGKVLEEHGFTPMKIELINGRRPTMKTLLREYEGYIIVGLIAGHEMCAKGGKVRDIWDSSTRPLYKYWIKKE